MRLKSEFRFRLCRLYRVIGHVLDSDARGDVHIGNLFPYLFSVYSLVWSCKAKELLKK